MSYVTFGLVEYVPQKPTHCSCLYRLIFLYSRAVQKMVRSLSNFYELFPVGHNSVDPMKPNSAREW